MTNVVLVLARTLHLGSAMMLVALPYFALIVLKPVLISSTVTGYLPFVRTLTRWLWILWLVEAVSGATWFWLVAAGMADRSPWQIPASSDLTMVLWQTQFGRLWCGRLGLGIILGVMLVLISRSNRMTLPSASWREWCILGISTVLLITLAWAGHGVAGVRHHVLHLVADVVHLLISSVWPMGLIPLGLFLQSALRRDVFPEKAEMALLLRFSSASLVAVLILIATGFINGWLMMGSWGALVSTTYGELLLAKVLAVALMIVLGACNRLYLLPRVREGASMVRSLRRTVLVESGLAGFVLLIVGIMGMTSPPPQ